jgi:hypothetical protein
MSRLRSQDGYLSYIGIVAALVIVMFLTASSFKQLGFGGTNGAAGAANDSAAQAEVQHAFSALETCARGRGGSFQGCGVDQIIENEPTLAPARGRITVAASGTSAQASVKSSTGNAFTIAVDAGVVIRPCSTAGRGACPAAARW